MKRSRKKDGCMGEFIAFLLIQMVLLLSIKEANEVVSFYDAVVCLSMYSHMTVYVMLPFFYIVWLKNDLQAVKIVKYRSSKKLWFSYWKYTIRRALVYVAELVIVVTLCGICCADRLCDWDKTYSLYYRYNIQTAETVPSVCELLFLLSIVFLVNCIMIGLIIVFSRFTWNVYSFGYAIVVMIYVLPSIPGVPVEFNRMTLQYSDFINESTPIVSVAGRLMIEVAIIIFVSYLGIVKEKRDYLEN